MPGTTEWYNVKYDGEDDILTLNLLLDIEKGDLDVILQPSCYMQTDLLNIHCNFN